MKNTVAAVLFMTLATGCGFAAGLLAPADITSVNSAVSRKDEAWLDKVCKGEYPARKDSDKEYACHQLDRLRGPSKALAASCEEVIKSYEDAPKEDFTFVSAMGNKMAECGHYSYLFEHVVHWGNGNEGVKLLNELEDKGKPMEAEFKKYLESHKGPQYFAVKDGAKNDVLYGMDHITQWLIGKGRTQLCGAFAESAKGAGLVSRVATMDYFKQAKCKEGIPLATELLLEELPGDRILGCEILGAIGDGSVLEKVKIVAESDGFSTVKEEERNGRVWATKVYPVRDACLEASGKIKLRK